MQRDIILIFIVIAMVVCTATINMSLDRLSGSLESMKTSTTCHIKTPHVTILDGDWDATESRGE